MAKLPESVPVVTRAAVMRLRRRLMFKPHRGMVVAQKWPRKRGPNISPLQRAWVDRFSLLGCFLKNPDVGMYDAARDWAKGSGWYWRDVLTAAANGNLIEEEGEVKIVTPSCYITRVTNQALSAGILTPVSFTAETWDNNVFWSPTPNPTRVTVRAAGLYLLGCNAFFAAGAADAQRAMRLRINGADLMPWNFGQDIANPPIGISQTIPWYFHPND